MVYASTAALLFLTEVFGLFTCNLLTLNGARIGRQTNLFNLLFTIHFTIVEGIRARINIMALKYFINLITAPTMSNTRPLELKINLVVRIVLWAGFT